MKKFLQFFIMVVVALISGFPQCLIGQSKTCYELKTKFYVHDSSYWKMDTVQLKNILAGAQNIINKAGFNKNFRFVYAGWDSIGKNANAYAEMKRKEYPGSLQASLKTDFPKFEKDSSIVFPVFLGNVRMSLLNYPGAETGWSVCRPGWLTWPQFGYNNIILLRNDSLARFDDSLYIRMFTHEVLGRLGASEYPLPGYLMSSRANIYSMTNIIDQATISAINIKTYDCLKQLNDCILIDTKDHTELPDHEVVVSHGILYNPQKRKIGVYDIMGHRLFHSNGTNVDLSNLVQGFIILIVDNKWSIKTIN